MTDRDDETFSRFAERFAKIEPLVSDRPATSDRRAAIRRGPATVVAMFVIALVVGGVVLGGRPGQLGTAASGPVADATTVPSVAATDPSSPSPRRSTEPVALAPLDPAQPPREVPPPCLVHMTTTDRLLTTPAQDATSSLTVVIGSASGVGAAQWNTVDSQPPRQDDADAGSVLRLVRIEVESTIRGVPVPSLITVWILGGAIGCQQYWIGGFPPTIAVGDRYVVFLRSGVPRIPLDGVFEAWQLWAIHGDSVTTEFTPNLRLDDVLNQMRGDSAPTESP
jgi:hypothetical protein